MKNAEYRAKHCGNVTQHRPETPWQILKKYTFRTWTYANFKLQKSLKNVEKNMIFWEARSKLQLYLFVILFFNRPRWLQMLSAKHYVSFNLKKMNSNSHFWLRTFFAKLNLRLLCHLMNSFTTQTLTSHISQVWATGILLLCCLIVLFVVTYVTNLRMVGHVHFWR